MHDAAAPAPGDPSCTPTAAAPRCALLSVDLEALRHNYRALAARAAPAACGACVKADAYGLGLEQVARSLAAAGCEEFFVATAGEGGALRRLLPAATLYVLNGYAASDAAAYAAARLVPVLNDLEQARSWCRDFAGAPAALHVDTGMARLGMEMHELAALSPDSALRRQLDLRLVLSHLACADVPDDPRNLAQQQRFEEALTALGRPRASFAGSSGIHLGAAYHYDLVRPGAALYGVNPIPAAPNPMRAVVHLEAPVLQVREIRHATDVGYGATHRVSPPARIATIGAGYADGYPRAAGGRARARVAGVEVPVVGRVSMDLITLDVSALPPGAVTTGSLATLIDAAYGVDALAAAADTIGYEILTHLGSVTRRTYLHAGAATPA